MSESDHDAVLVWNGQVAKPARRVRRGRRGSGANGSAATEVAAALPPLPGLALGIVDGVLGVDDPRPRALDVPDRARHGSVEPVLDLRVGAAALGSLEQPLGLLEREVGLVQPRIGGTGDADPESEHQRCDRRDDDQ